MHSQNIIDFSESLELRRIPTDPTKKKMKVSQSDELFKESLYNEIGSFGINPEAIVLLRNPQTQDKH